jgi:phosphate transport system substrate-binding protein
MTEGGQSSKTPLTVGAIVGGGYRVVRPIADGGMGAVFEVEQLATGARRALKVMHVQLASDPKLRARFVQEARVGVAIASDHVADVIDAGVDEATELPFLVLELLDGVTLSRELRRRGAFEWVLAREVFRQLGHAVVAAHAKGIIHRDLKPSNIFLAQSRTAGMPFVLKVLDFGIAEIVASVQQGGGIIGTPTWMAPEQASPHAPIGPTADVWALGLIAFALFTGRNYWPIANIEAAPTDAMLRRLASEEIVPASVRAASYGISSLPSGFDEWFGRCVDRDPARRYPDAAQACALFAEMMDLAIGREPRVKVPTIAPPEPIEAPQASTLDGEVPTRAPTRRTRTALRRRIVRGAVATAAILAVASAALFVVRPHSDSVAAVAAPPPVSDAPVGPPSHVLARIHGSNTIGAELAPALAEAFLAKETGNATPVRKRTADDEMRIEARTAEGEIDAIEIYAHGSSTAFKDLASGACDVGMSSRRIHPDEIDTLAKLGAMASAASEHVIALDGIAVIVNPASSVDRLTLASLAQIFGGDAKRWSDVGGGDSPIVLHARDDRSGTYDTFKSLVLGSHTMSLTAKRYESSDALADAVAADANAIGFVGLAYVRSAKAVMIQDASSTALLPSPTTVASEEYPLSRRLYLYAPPAAPEAARRFVDFALSDDGQAIVSRTGFVDLRPKCDANATVCSTCGPDAKRALEGACRVSVDFRIDPSSKQLDTRALRDLQRVGSLLARGEYAGRKVILLGFSDGTTKRAESEAISLARAQAVAGQLRARGLAVSATLGLGARMPIGDDATDVGRERNRRVEVWLR